MSPPAALDVVCVIHGTPYDFCYVDKLYSMLSRRLPGTWRFHVLTESTRPVPSHMIKHEILEWPNVQGRRAAWWYKLQLFRPELALQQVLYLDLDTVIVDDLNWIWDLDPRYFWSIRDFRYLWRSNYSVMNSSFLYFDCQKFHYIWHDSQSKGIAQLRQTYKGDQDYLSQIVSSQDLRFIDPEKVQSWRWQVFDGGLDIRTRQYKNPGQGAVLPRAASIVVYHGSPKPHEINDPMINLHWQ